MAYTFFVCRNRKIWKQATAGASVIVVMGNTFQAHARLPALPFPILCPSTLILTLVYSTFLRRVLTQSHVAVDSFHGSQGSLLPLVLNHSWLFLPSHRCGQARGDFIFDVHRPFVFYTSRYYPHKPSRVELVPSKRLSYGMPLRAPPDSRKMQPSNAVASCKKRPIIRVYN